MGFEKLIDLIVQFLEFFRFCTIIDCYEKGVHLRRGNFYRIVEPGIRFQIPFYWDAIHNDSVVTQVYQCTTQSLVTADAKPVAMGITITYHIEDIAKALLEVQTVDTAVRDACLCTAAEHVAKSTYDEIRDPKFVRDLTRACNKLASRFGLVIESVRYNELAPLRTYRMITGS